MKENIILRFIRKSCRLICHQKEERCFKIKNYVFPVCARCTGILLSCIIAFILIYNKIYLNIIVSLILFLIMGIDWIIQALKIKESTNLRRFITGLIGGFGMIYFYYYIIMFLKFYM